METSYELLKQLFSNIYLPWHRFKKKKNYYYTNLRRMSWVFFFVKCEFTLTIIIAKCRMDRPRKIIRITYKMMGPSRSAVYHEFLKPNGTITANVYNVNSINLTKNIYEKYQSSSCVWPHLVIRCKRCQRYNNAYRMLWRSTRISFDWIYLKFWIIWSCDIDISNLYLQLYFLVYPYIKLVCILFSFLSICTYL